MQSEMIRHKQEIKDLAEIEGILARAQVLRLAMSQGDQPYLVPLCFGYANGIIYLHTGPRGHKLDILRVNPRVCFEVEDEVEPIAGQKACSWNMHYRSVVGFGNAVVVEDDAERLRGLRLVTEHYAGPGEHDLPPDKAAKATVIRLEIASMTGRRSSD